jgi:hypothetical protein
VISVSPGAIGGFGAIIIFGVARIPGAAVQQPEAYIGGAAVFGSNGNITSRRHASFIKIHGCVYGRSLKNSVEPVEVSQKGLFGIS